MPLSVNITLEVVNADVNPANPDLKLHVRFNGMSGTVYTTWESLISGGEATGIVSEPAGKGRPTSHKRRKRMSMQQEHVSASTLGGHRQAGSGARPGNKGDGQVLDQGTIDALQGGVGRFRIENKYRTGGQVIIKLSELMKIRSECAGREIPVFDVQFREDGTYRILDNWVLIPRKAFENLAQASHD